MNAPVDRAEHRHRRAVFLLEQATRLFPRTLVLSLASLTFSVAVNGAEIDVDEASGLVIAAGFEQVRAQCTACHSGRLVAQNRADRDGWLQMIRWMQDTQNLWPLGDAEAQILDYLAANYGPLPRGRRVPLDVSF